jgi:hypothetical protein
MTPPEVRPTMEVNKTPLTVNSEEAIVEDNTSDARRREKTETLLSTISRKRSLVADPMTFKDMYTT